MVAQLFEIIPRLLWNLKCYYRVHNSPSLSLFNLLHILTLSSANIHFHTIHSSTPVSVKWFLPLRRGNKLYTYLTSWSCRSSAVRRWLPTAAARVRVRAARGVCGGQSGTGAGFLRVLRFPQSIIPPISPLS
jgi:hypothetical protein